MVSKLYLSGIQGQLFDEDVTGGSILDDFAGNLHQRSVGGGIHYCPDAPLARMESQIDFECLFRRLPSMTLDETGLQCRNLINLRGIEHLPVKV